MRPMLLIVGGGIGGLAASIAAGRAGWQVKLFEQAKVYTEVGAGIQLGPNAMRVLKAWGLGSALADLVCAPQCLRVRDGHSGQELGILPLASHMQQRYGAPYCTLHRADLHRVLLQAAVQNGVRLHLQSAIQNIAVHAHSVSLSGQNIPEFAGQSLLGADGLWSAVRQHILRDGAPRATGHVAWRAMLPVHQLPAGIAADEVSVWLAPQMHLVCYPVRGGTQMNLVLIAAGSHAAQQSEAAHDWSQAADTAALRRIASGLHDAPAALLEAPLPTGAQWTQWSLYERPPVASAAQMAQGRIALLGDAAHPMRPYLAQGAAMALEDAAQLGRCLAGSASADVPAALQAYAQARWQRSAAVQRRAQRNGAIFHASGPLRAARNLAMRVGGAQLLDLPWLYGLPGTPPPK